MNKLLMNEHPLVILPELATRIGLNEAIVLQQIHYWVQKSNHDIGGVKWVYNTVEEWSKQFPFFSPSTVRRTLEKLEAEGFVVTGNFNKSKIDKTKWYAIHYVNLQKVTDSPFVNSAGPFVQNEQMDSLKVSDSIAQSEQMHVSNLSKAIPETTQKLQQETTTTTAIGGGGDKNGLMIKNVGEMVWFIKAQWGAQGNIGHDKFNGPGGLNEVAKEIGLEEMQKCIEIVGEATPEKRSVRYLKGVIAKRAAERIAKASQSTVAAVSNSGGLMHFECETCGREAQIQVAELLKHRGETFGCEGCDTRHSVDKYLGEVAV